MSFNTALDLSAEEVQALETLRTRFHPLVWNLGHLQQEMVQHMDTPPHLPTSQRYAALVKTHVRALMEYFDEPVSQAGVHLKRDGKVLTVRDLLSALRPHPVAPFPAFIPETGPNGIIDTLLRRNLAPEDESWIDERVCLGAEFCEVSEEFPLEEIQARRPAAKVARADGSKQQWSADSISKNDEDEQMRRTTSHLNGEEISNIWSTAGATVGELFILFEKAVKGTEDMGEGTNDEDLERIDKIREQLGVDEEEETPTKEPGADDGKPRAMQGVQSVEQYPLRMSELHKILGKGR
ncbi:uncharacterized protein EI97DRAFT_462614 [Westerdykella ornata]|uniref:Uncharacterized protein n=1 Tax=Westerdykella ornata TaxID=318751 RepID=A0A6A6J7P4_WESOR|nr:uncharacterized protein EI97DRAFT_462614 [Westerdykella ornata]KAF2271646.1 hypothetical protein EI97DRAFT_462614 [Westerdykella ornata]